MPGVYFSAFQWPNNDLNSVQYFLARWVIWTAIQVLVIRIPTVIVLLKKKLDTEILNYAHHRSLLGIANKKWFFWFHFLQKAAVLEPCFSDNMDNILGNLKKPAFRTISRKPTLRIAKFEGIAYIWFSDISGIRESRI